MHRDIDAPFIKRMFDFLGEQPLATNLAQRAILYLIPGGRDHHNLERILGQGMPGHQPGAGLAGLGQGKRRTTGANAKRVF